MTKNIRTTLQCAALIALLPILTSCCWWPIGNICSKTTKYNGSRTLQNKSYTNLEIHGASTLEEVIITGTFICAGSAELTKTSIEGSTKISGKLTTEDSKLQGNVHASKIIAKETTFAKDVHASSINATDSTFANIFSKSDKLMTYRFTNSRFADLNIEGLGDKVVILNNTTAKTITFENQGGIVKLQGNASVETVINGTIERTPLTTTAH